VNVSDQVPSPAHPADRTESGPEEIPPEKWQALEALCKAILGLEASIDSVRLGMDGTRAEMEAAFKKSLSVEDKLNCLQADVAQWTKAKTRVHYALPKVREFIHRATWAAAVPERKRLEEIHKEHIEPRNPLPEVDRVREQLEHLQKDRQVLFAQGNNRGTEMFDRFASSIRFRPNEPPVHAFPGDPSTTSPGLDRITSFLRWETLPYRYPGMKPTHDEPRRMIACSEFRRAFQPRGTSDARQRGHAVRQEEEAHAGRDHCGSKVTR
jgi:hypothetical protein